jgi:hypothetical protein
MNEVSSFLEIDGNGKSNSFLLKVRANDFQSSHLSRLRTDVMHFEPASVSRSFHSWWTRPERKKWTKCIRICVPLSYRVHERWRWEGSNAPSLQGKVPYPDHGGLVPPTAYQDGTGGFVGTWRRPPLHVGLHRHFLRRDSPPGKSLVVQMRV